MCARSGDKNMFFDKFLKINCSYLLLFYLIYNEIGNKYVVVLNKYRVLYMNDKNGNLLITIMTSPA